MAAVFSWLPNLLRRRKRDALLAAAANWPVLTAHLLKSQVVARDPLAEGGTAFQESQIESAFYFTLSGSYHGGHIRSIPLSDSEAHRLLKSLPEDTPVTIRYNPQNPDEATALSADNPGLPIALWPTL